MTTTCFLTVFVAALCGLVTSEQHFFGTQVDNNGVLRRFNIETAVPQILAVAEEHDLDVWHATKSFVDIYSPPDAPFLPAELANMPHTTTPIPSQPPSKLTHETITDWNVTSLRNSTFHDAYHPLHEVESFLNQLVSAFPNMTTLTNLGRTAEGRQMVGLTVSSGKYAEEEEDDDGKKKKKKKKKTKAPIGRDGEKLGFVIIGAQHAREWVATSTSLYLAHALLANKNETYSLSGLLEHFDFHFIPLPNPDGYAYTWEKDRYWYKNRQILGPYTKCVGLDMNRNWGYKWKSTAVGMSSAKSDLRFPRDPTHACSAWFPGMRPFESYEVNNMANWITILPNLVGFIDLRSYGQMLSVPYSYSCKRSPKDAEDQIEAAIGASQALRHVHGTQFDVGSLCSNLYPAHGNVLDWMYAREAVKYSYVAHLRDTGTYGFSLPEKWIRPTAEETSRLLDYLAKFIGKQAKRKF